MMLKKLAILSAILFSASFVRAEEINVYFGHAPHANLIEVHGAAFEKETGIKLKIMGDPVSNSATNAFKKVLSGEADVGAAGIYFPDWANLMKKENISQADIDSITHRIVGKDVVKVVAHAKVPVDSVTMADLASLFLGNAKTWEKWGDKATPVTIILMSQLPATTAFFKKTVLKNAEFGTNSKTVPSPHEMADVLAKTPGGIAFCSGTLKTPDGIKTLKTAEEISRPLTIVTKGKPKDSVMKLIRFLQSKQKD